MSGPGRRRGLCPGSQGDATSGDENIGHREGSRKWEPGAGRKEVETGQEGGWRKAVEIQYRVLGLWREEEGKVEGS